MTESQMQAKLDEIQRLIAEINEAEKDDPQFAWRPWQLRRRGDRHR